MTRILARLPNSSEYPEGSDRPRTRKEARREPKGVGATISAPDGDFKSPVKDISLHGCRIVDGGLLRMGQFVKIGVTGHRPVTGIVRWVREGYAGIEFMSPVSWDDTGV